MMKKIYEEKHRYYWKKNQFYYNREDKDKALKIFDGELVKIKNLELQFTESENKISIKINYFGEVYSFSTNSINYDDVKDIENKKDFIDTIFTVITHKLTELDIVVEKFSKEFILDNYQNYFELIDEEFLIKKFTGIYETLGSKGINFKFNATLTIKLNKLEDYSESNIKELVLSNKVESELNYILVKDG